MTIRELRLELKDHRHGLSEAVGHADRLGRPELSAAVEAALLAVERAMRVAAGDEA